MTELIQHFHFIRPWWLLALLPLATLWLLSNKAQRSQHNWAKVCDAHLLPHLLVQQPGTRGLMPWALLALAWSIAVLALAGPAWHRLPQPVYTQNKNQIIVFDLSDDMQVADILPSRLVRARYKLLDLLHQIHEGQTGLVVYSGEPYVVSPLTEDANTIASMVGDLSPAIMPVPGNNLSSGLKMAAKLFKQADVTEGNILVITAGKADAAALNEAKALQKAGYTLSVLGVGTTKNTPLLQSDGQFAQDKTGAIVFSRLDIASLQQLAQAGKGNYVTFSNDNSDLKALLIAPNNMALKQTEAKATTQLWQDSGLWLVWLLLPLSLLAFRRGWLGGAR